VALEKKIKNEALIKIHFHPLNHETTKETKNTSPWTVQHLQVPQVARSGG
jgi:hypothetical protein